MLIKCKDERDNSYSLVSSESFTMIYQDYNLLIGLVNENMTWIISEKADYDFGKLIQALNRKDLVFCGNFDDGGDCSDGRAQDVCEKNN